WARHNKGYLRSAGRSRSAAQSCQSRWWVLSISIASSSACSTMRVLALGHLVAAGFVLGGDRLAGLFIAELLAQAIAGGLVDLPQRDALGTRAGRMERNRTGDQSQFEIAFPVGTHHQPP